MLESPTSVMYWGRSRRALDLMAFGYARRINPRFGWIEVCDRTEPPDPEEEMLTGMLPADQLLLIDRPEEFLPPAAPETDGLRAMRRTGAPPAPVDRLSDLLWLPPPIRELARRLADPGRVGAIVLANADRLARLVPDLGPIAGAIVHAINRENLTIIVTACRRPSELYKQTFDYVFRIDPEPGRSWKDSLMVAERRATAGPFRVGEPLPARLSARFAEAVRIVEAAGSPPGASRGGSSPSA